MHINPNPGYDYRITRVEGKFNTVADAMSRIVFIALIVLIVLFKTIVLKFLQYISLLLALI